MSHYEVALSLRDRKAKRFLDVARAIDVQEQIRLYCTHGYPVAERQGYFEGC